MIAPDTPPDAAPPLPPARPALRAARRAAGDRELHDRARIRDQLLARELLGPAPHVREPAEVHDRPERVADRARRRAVALRDPLRDGEAVEDADPAARPR